MTQREQILRHLKAGRCLTALEALRRFNCLRLAARINDLRDVGHTIQTRIVTTRTRKRIAVYRMG
jgi:hypothetical protein